jgi:homocysteine S-methyltransferase
MGINYPLLLDGGLSNELENQGLGLQNNLWTASLLSEHFSSIVNAHLSYLNAGARCIITSSYQASIQGFLKQGYSKEDASNLILKSVTAAVEARKKYLDTNKKEVIYIAGSIGPYGAILADGSEYTGDYNLNKKLLANFHLPRIQLLDSSDIDFFACETIPSYKETEVLSEILIKTRKKAWVSFACKDDSHINDGTAIETCIKLLADHPNIFALGVNCTHPKYIGSLIRKIKPLLKNKKLVIYPNSGESYNPLLKTWGQSRSGKFCSLAESWINMGADIIGGCCRVGPQDIAEMKKLLKSH